MTPVIETHALTKRYGAHEAVLGLSLTVPAGTISGFLGQNGAGKSTTFKMLLGLVRPSAGEGRVLGHRIDLPAESLEIRRRVAFVGEDKRLYDYMTVGQIIRFTRAFFPRWRADLERKLLRAFNLPPERKVRKLSKGMRTQLALLLAFCRGADLLLLDEPSEGLDPVVAEQVLELVVGMAAEGATVFFSSHQIAEVEQVAEHVFIIDRGRLLLDAPLDQMKLDYRRIQFVFEEPVPELRLPAEGVERVAVSGRTVDVFASGNVQAIVAQGKGQHAASVDIYPVSLKEIFFESLRSK